MKLFWCIMAITFLAVSFIFWTIFDDTTEATIYLLYTMFFYHFAEDKD